MLRTDYKYSRKPSLESATERLDRVGLADSATGLLSAPEPNPADGEHQGAKETKRGGSVKHWSPLAALSKRAREGLRRCNTVRAGLGWTRGDVGTLSSTSSSSTAASTSATPVDSTLANRRNAMPNIFLGLPSRGVRRLFAIYGIDYASSTAATTPRPHSAASTASAASKCEESLFARHSRTSSVRSRRPPNYAGPMQQQHYQHMLMMQQQQHHLMLPPSPGLLAPTLPLPPQPGGGQFIDKRRASSMRESRGRQQRKASSCYGNW